MGGIFIVDHMEKLWVAFTFTVEGKELNKLSATKIMSADCYCFQLAAIIFIPAVISELTSQLNYSSSLYFE